MEVPYPVVWMGAVIIFILSVGMLRTILSDEADRKLPDFITIADIQERKAAFFAYMEPLIGSANKEVLAQRKRIIRFRNRFERGHINYRDVRWLRDLGISYSVRLVKRAPITADQIERLLVRVDMIPPSMAIAQAAIESGWGTSRFARQGNNLFGTWCYEPGCGIIPRNRAKGAPHEVKRYASPGDSMRDYIQNLNSNSAYIELRRIRAQLRKSGKLLDGLTVSDGLYRYSGNGWAYVDKVQHFIQSNYLDIFDEIQN